MSAEERAEMGLVFEPKSVRYLLDSEACGCEQRFRLQENVLVEPRTNRPARRFLDDIRQIFGRDAQLFRIPRYLLMLNAVLLYKTIKVCHQLLRSGAGRLSFI